MRLLMTLATLVSVNAQALPLEQIKLPAGYQITTYAEKIPDARSMALSPSGILFVGTRKAGNVYAVVRAAQSGQKNQVITIAKGQDM